MPEFTKQQKAAMKLEEKLSALGREAECLGLIPVSIYRASFDIAKQGRYRQRIYGHNPEGWIANGSCRIVIWGPLKHKRMLFGEGDNVDAGIPQDLEYSVYPKGIEEARETARKFCSEYPEFDSYEIHEYRAGEWFTVGAGKMEHEKKSAV